MKRTKIDFGIDLGTTNSAIASIENGRPTIRKSDTLKDTMPSCVGFNRKKIISVGDNAHSSLKSEKLKAMATWGFLNYNTFIEFKRTMGTDKKYPSSHMEEEYDSEKLSAEVLKKLRSFVTDENFKAVVITVPAKFDIRQKDATFRAAKLAGFEYVELLQEPIAASMAYGLDARSKNGYWVVFDFGGGTFDAALVKVEEGIMQVLDTEGDNYLGGKNLDYKIVDEIIIPYFQKEYVIDSILADDKKRQILRDAMKYFAEEAKIQLSFQEQCNILSDLGDIPGEDDEGEEFELDITLSRDDLEKTLAPVFQKAIDITKDLIGRNNLSGDKLDSLILVGGPTYSTILRRMLEEQIKSPDTSADPMTVVATGAALYASTLDVSDEIKEASRDATRIQLDVGYEASTIELEEWVTLKILPEKTQGPIPDQVFAELIRDDQAWSSGKTEINDMGEIIEVKLNEGKPNTYEIMLYDEVGNRLKGQPDNFTIIQGAKVGNATLPYHIGIETKRKEDNKLVFTTVKGLKKNQPLPAKGVLNGFKTQQLIRPGIPEDQIRIPIYQGDYYSEGTRAIYNEHVYDVTITGDDLPSLLPENSDVDLTLITDRSGRIEKVEAYFPYLDFTAEVQIPAGTKPETSIDSLARQISMAKRSINDLNYGGHTNSQEIDALLKELEHQQQYLAQGRTDSDRKNEVLESLRKTLKEIDRLHENTEWPILEEALRGEFERLEKANNELGSDNTSREIENLRLQVDEVIRKKDSKIAGEILEKIRSLFFNLTLIYQLIDFVRYHSENFDVYSWKNSQIARQLIYQAEEMIVNNPTVDSLHPLVVDLINELPDDEQKGENLDLLMR